MSIRDEINAHVSARRLFYLPAILGGWNSPIRREMVVSPDIYAAVSAHGAWSHDRMGERLGRLRAALDRFTNGDKVSVALHPTRKPPWTYLARIKPVNNEVWDVRCTKPGNVRVLGRFGERDLFIALVWDVHENVMGDQAWADFGEKCLQEWWRLFSTRAPHRGTTVNDYISNNFVPV